MAYGVLVFESIRVPRGFISIQSHCRLFGGAGQVLASSGVQDSLVSLAIGICKNISSF